MSSSSSSSSSSTLTPSPTSPVLTTSTGSPVDDNQSSVTVGVRGPIVLQDFHLIDKIAHFDRERIPERVVHAKGAGAHGYFEVTDDVTMFTKAKFLEKIGKRTPMFARFSTVGGEKGSADTARDPRGFALKFYTEEGNYDLVGNNTPIFFIRDPIKFPDFIHTQKRNPQTNLKDPMAFWDFLSLVPESCHQVTILFSDRGTPVGYRHMEGFGSHTFKWVNKEGVAHWVKVHFKTESGVKNFTTEEADRLASEDPDFATRDLFEHIEKGGVAAWKMYVQVMKFDDAYTYRWDPFDVTKVWPHKDYPLIPVGRMVLNRNPENYFAETEQAAFSPSHMVPGIEPSPDRMLQGRLFSYPDTHRHRLGVNYQQIPINCPFATKGGVKNGQRDGFMAVSGNQGKMPNYEPNTQGGPAAVGERARIHPQEYSGRLERTSVRVVQKGDNDDFEQCGNLYRLMDEGARSRLVSNLVGHMKNCPSKAVLIRQCGHFYRADQEYGTRVANGLGIDVAMIKPGVMHAKM